MSNNISKKDDASWYEDDAINLLLQHYLSANPNVEILTAMLGTDWLGTEGANNTLQANLQGFHQQRSINNSAALADKNNTAKNKVIVPINLSKNHWSLLYILYNEKDNLPSAIYYFDPFGNPINNDVKQAVSRVFPDTEIVNINVCVQNDGYNCGPWVIEAARSLVDAGATPDCDINAARQEHEKIQAQVSNSSARKNKPELTIDTDTVKNANLNRISTKKLPSSPAEVSPRTRELVQKMLTQRVELSDLDVDNDVKEIDQLLIEQCAQLKVTFKVDKVKDLLENPQFKRQLSDAEQKVVKQVILKAEQGSHETKANEQNAASKPLSAEEAQIEADRRFAMVLQNAEVSSFLLHLSQTKFQPKPYLPVKATRCAMETSKQQDSSGAESVETRTNFGIA